MIHTDSRRYAAPAALVFAGWTLLALLFVPQAYVINQRAPVPPTWGQAAVAQLPMFWGWALLTPLVVWVGRRFPLERRRFGRTLALYLAAALGFSFVHLYVAGAGHWILGWIRGVARPLRLDALAVSYGATNVLICCGIFAASQALMYFRRYQDRELRLVQAQLASLRTQLHPHFLFNTLNAIAELLHEDPSRAERTLTQLSELLRRALASGGEHEVALAEEIDFLRAYVDIQQTLLGDRLRVRWRVDDDTLDARVPAMLLQPLVENAIQHGIGPRAAGGTIRITAARDGALLRMSVEDDGRGFAEGAVSREGIGLPNTRARLLHMYGEGHTFLISSRPGGGVLADLSMPFRAE